MITTKLSADTPCADPHQTLTSTIAAMTPFELARINTTPCKKQDPNYRKLGASISLYDLQTQNGITKMIEDEPNFTFYVFSGNSVKKATIMEAYGRATIPWKLECEQSKFTKMQMAQTVMRGLKAVEPRPVGGFVSLLIYAVITMVTGAREVHVLTILMGLTSLAFGGVGLYPFIKFFNYHNRLGEDIEFLNQPEMGFLSTCSSADYALSADLLEAMERNQFKVGVYATILGVWSILCILFPILMIINLVLRDASGNCRCGGCIRCSECPQEFVNFIKGYLEFN